MMNQTIMSEEKIIVGLRPELGSYETLVSLDERREACEWLTYFSNFCNDNNDPVTYVRGGLTVTVMEVTGYFAA
jgi:hypothetical protein